MAESLFGHSEDFYLKSGFFFYFFTFFVYCSAYVEAYKSAHESFVLNYNISDSEILWSYSACTSLRTFLYFTDYSHTVVSLFESDPGKVIKYSTKLYESQIVCPSYQNFTLNLRGNLFFVLKTELANESFYEPIQFSTTDKYKCEFPDFSSLEIHKKNNSIKFVGPEKYYQVYSHGDLENPEGLQGELGAFLCNFGFLTGKWTENCKDPSMLVGKKIASESASCILQGESFKGHRGKCYFNSSSNKGFLVFTESDNHVKVSGVCQSKGEYVLSIAGDEVDLKSQEVGSWIYLYGKAQNKEVIGAKVKIFNGNSSDSCVVGISPGKAIKDSTGQRFGGIWIFVILTISLVAILVVEIKSKMSV